MSAKHPDYDELHRKATHHVAKILANHSNLKGYIMTDTNTELLREASSAYDAAIAGLREIADGARYSTFTHRGIPVDTQIFGMLGLIEDHTKAASTRVSALESQIDFLDEELKTTNNRLAEAMVVIEEMRQALEAVPWDERKVYQDQALTHAEQFMKGEK